VWPAIRAAHVAGTVIVAGPLSASDVFEHLAAADVHVNPSLCESLNMVTVEAAAVGTPTITSDGAGIAHWVSAYHAGAVVPAGEGGKLADAIIFAFQNMAELAAWATASRAMASEFTLDRIAAGLLSMMSGEHARTPGLTPA
jgi:glycosyltransferase involved in cell wall biosynthesis